MHSNLSFKGVIPVKVYMNGNIVKDNETVHKACLEAVKVISGPLSDTPKFKPAAAQLSTMDNGYNYFRAYYGYANKNNKTKPSDFFKILMDKFNNGFIVTGKPAEVLTVLGKKIGKARQECNSLNIRENQKLIDAKTNYWKALHQIKDDAALRIREIYDPATLAKHGKHQQMNLDVELNPVKNKVILNSITFSNN